MSEPHPPTRLRQLLDRLREAGEDPRRVTVGEMLESVGRRSFGPLLLVPGLVALSPLGAIPGMPTTVAVTVLLVTTQLLLGRGHFWLPRWLLRRSASRDRLDRALRFLHPVARRVDRFTRLRMTALTRDPAVRAIALLCTLIALVMPAMEVIPLTIHVVGAAFTAFGLALMMRDGVLALLALGFCAATATLVAQALL